MGKKFTLFSLFQRKTDPFNGTEVSEERDKKGIFSMFREALGDASTGAKWKVKKEKYSVTTIFNKVDVVAGPGIQVVVGRKCIHLKPIWI